MLQQLSKLLSGSALGQLIAFLFIPLLTHLYEPEVFGEYQVAFSVALFIAILLSWKLEIPIPTIDESKISTHIKNVASLVSINSIVLFIALYLITTHTSLLPEALDNSSLLMFTLVMAILMAFNNLARFYLIEKQKFGTISMTLFCQSGGRSVLQWLLQAMSNLGLLIGDVLARVTMLAMSVRVMRKEPQQNKDSTNLKQTLSEHWRYPVWVMPSTLLNSSMAIMLLPLIAYKFGAVEAGIVAVAYRLITAPNSVIGAALSDVLFARFSKLAKAQQLKQLKLEFVKISMGLAGISVAGFSIIYFLSDYLGLVVAAEYVLASEYMIALIPWFAAQFMVTPLSRIVFIFNKQLVKLIIDVLIFANLVALVWFTQEQPVVQFLSDISMNMALIYGAYLAVLYFILFNQKAEVSSAP